MAKVLIVFVILATSLSYQIANGLPESHFYRVHEVNNEDNALSDEPILYHGAQLWNIPYQSEFARNTILGLQDNFGELKFDCSTGDKQTKIASQRWKTEIIIDTNATKNSSRSFTKDDAYNA